MNRTLDEYEKIYWPKGEEILGIDEAGRGPLCGPLVVAGCILPISFESELIDDSKRLSAKKRKKAFKEILDNALYYNVKIVSNRRIDELNIYKATQSAMEKIAKEAFAKIVLTDAMPLNIEDKKVIPIVKGDHKSINIAAASIIAKVIRDGIMMKLDEKYPEYELRKHKGYPTKRHLELLSQYGLKDFYRKSYGPCRKLLEYKLF